MGQFKFPEPSYTIGSSGYFVLGRIGLRWAMSLRKNVQIRVISRNFDSLAIFRRLI